MAANDTYFFFGDSKVAISDPVAYHQIVATEQGKIDRFWGKFGRTLLTLTTNSQPSVQSLVESDTVVGLNEFIDGIFRYDISMDLYFICFGTNDVIQFSDPFSTAANFKVKYRDYLDKLLTVDVGVPLEKLKIINCDIIDFSKFPVPGNKTRLDSFNAAIAELGVEFDIQVLDVYANQLALNTPNTILSPDGLHLSAYGNEVNASYILENISDYVPPDPNPSTYTIKKRFNIVAV